MKDILSKIYFGISILIDIVSIGFLGLILFIYTIDFSLDDILVALSMLVGLVPTFALDILYFMRCIKKKEYSLLKAILIKGILFNFSGFLMFISPEFDDYESSIIFLVITAFFVFGWFAIKSVKKPKVYQVNRINRMPGIFDGFEAENEYEMASREYQRIHSISYDSYSDEDIDAIYEYASMPFIYFFMWLFVHDYCSKEFYSQFDALEIEDIRNGYESPMELFKRIDFSFSRDDLCEEILPFVDSYYTKQENINIRYDHPIFLFDYYQLVKNDSRIFYCHSYSHALYASICRTINDRYASFQYDKEEYYEENSTGQTCSSSTWEGPIEITTCGNVDESYISSCITNFQNLPSSTLEHMKRKLYEYANEEDEDYFDDFIVDEIVIFEPKGEEIAYILCGEADFEQEHGIHVVIFNQDVIEVGYRVDYDSPWSKRIQNIVNGMHKGIDFMSIQSNEDLKKAYQNKDIVTTYKVSPRFNGPREQENVVYITLEALEKKRVCEDIIDTLLAKRMDLHVECTPYFMEGYNIPTHLSLKALEFDKIVFIENIYIWD